MPSLTPLQKTIFNLAMNGGSVMLTEDKREDFESEDYFDEEKFNKGAIWQVCGFAPSDLMIPLGEGYFDGFLFRNGNTYVNFKRGYLPLLHSFNKLTENALEGGKVPIVELGKIAFGNRYNVVDAQIGDDGVFCTILTKNHRITKMVFSFETMSFYKVVDGTIKGFVPNQKQLFDQLNIWGFNTENLPEETFIEITSLKEK